MQYTIGIDVGGTNTDIVVVDENGKIMKTKKSLRLMRLKMLYSTLLNRLLMRDYLLQQ